MFHKVKIGNFLAILFLEYRIYEYNRIRFKFFLLFFKRLYLGERHQLRPQSFNLDYSYLSARAGLSSAALMDW
jgi:hypothetical protein